MLFSDADQDAQGQRTVDDGLADIQDLGVIPGQDFHQGSRQARAVFPGNTDEDLFVHISADSL